MQSTSKTMLPVTIMLVVVPFLTVAMTVLCTLAAGAVISFALAAAFLVFLGFTGGCLFTTFNLTFAYLLWCFAHHAQKNGSLHGGLIYLRAEILGQSEYVMAEFSRKVKFVRPRRADMVSGIRKVMGFIVYGALGLATQA